MTIRTGLVPWLSAKKHVQNSIMEIYIVINKLEPSNNSLKPTYIIHRYLENSIGN